MKYDFVVVIHRLYDKGTIKKGGVDLIVDYLLKRNNTILMIEYPLNYGQSNEMRVSQLTYGETTPLYISRIPIRINVICWVLEFFLTLTNIFRFAGTGGIIITSDPLTTLPAVLLRKAGMYKFHYYHSVDYSTDRFKNVVLNAIYLKLLKIGLKNADLVGIVTRQAAQRLTGYGVKRTIYIPNSLDFHSLDGIRKPINNRDRNSLVITCSDVSHKYLIMELVQLTGKLKEIYPAIKLNVVGKFDPKDSYCKELLSYTEDHNLQENIIFHGQVTRELNYQIIAQSYIGLAFYDGLHSHVIYGDAIKIREYAAFGLPSVADTHTYTAVEMNEVGAGYTVANVEAAFEKVRNLIDIEQDYKLRSEAALKWSKKYDKRKLLENLYTQYFK